jgi:sodium/potassium-transporting ATPase subunit alpha
VQSSGALLDSKLEDAFSLELSNIHCLTVDALQRRFSADITYGLTPEEAVKRLAKHGPNEMTKPYEHPVWLKFILSFFSGFAPLLWIACFFVFLSWKPFGTPPSNIYNLALAIVLLIVIFISGLFNFYQEVQTSQVMQSFTSMVPHKATVIRRGETGEIDPVELVVGDLVKLSSGMRVPSDIRIISSSSMEIDKSMLTGENEPQPLSPDAVADTVTYLQSTNMAFMGCNIVEGEGLGIVVSTGAQNQLSKISLHVSSVATKTTSLQVDINRFVRIIAFFAVVTAAVCIIVWAAYLDVEHSGFMTPSSMLANAISVLVAFVPEGLPLALSMGLTLIARRLCVVYSVLVKQLSILETVGSMSMLASDKTGTLTQNKMTVKSVVSFNSIFNANDEGIVLSPSALYHHAVMRIAVLCNQAKVNEAAKHCDETDSDGSLPATTPLVSGGNGVDRALMEFAFANNAIDSTKTLYDVKALLPFSSATKLAAVVVTTSSVNATTYGSYVLAKGAPEYILDRCTYYLDENGTRKILTPAAVDVISEMVKALGMKGERVIALAQDDLPLEDFPRDFVFKTKPDPNFPLTELTFVACVSVADPPRVGVREAVQTIRQGTSPLSLLNCFKFMFTI